MAHQLCIFGRQTKSSKEENATKAISDQKKKTNSYESDELLNNEAVYPSHNKRSQIFDVCFAAYS